MYYLNISSDLDLSAILDDLHFVKSTHKFLRSTDYVLELDVELKDYQKLILTLNNCIMQKYQELKIKNNTEFSIIVLKPTNLIEIKPWLIELKDFFCIKINKTDLKNQIIKQLGLYEKDISKVGKAERSEVIFENNAKTYIDYDVVEELYTTKELYRSLTVKGTNVFGPKITKLYNVLNLQYILKLEDLNFQEIIIPKFETFETWAKSGHIKLPEHHYIVSRFKPTPDVLKRYKIEGYLHKTWSIDNNDITTPYFGVSYAQCPGFWPSLEGISLKTADLPIKYFDNSGFTGRVEGNAIKSIQRLNFFSRIELLFIESDQLIGDLVLNILDGYKSIFDKLELKYRILKVGSWLDSNTNEQTQTYDFEAYIPWCDRWLEIGNVSNNGKTFLNNFKIKTEKNCSSGCSGVGKQRLVYAFLSQKGFESITWPTFIQAQVNINLFEKLY